MIEILRIYVRDAAGKEVCIREPEKIVAHLSSTEEIDLDYNDKRGHARMGSSRDFAGKIVRVGELEIEIPKD